MSLVTTNPANQLQTSGAIPVVFISGGASNVVYGQFGNSGAVPIEAFVASGVTSGLLSFGLMVGIGASGRKMAQTNKTGIDDWNPLDQSLLVSSFLNAKDDDNEWFTNVRGIRMVSGQSNVSMQASGFGLLTASAIIDTHGRIAENLNVNSGSNFTNIPTSGIALRTVSAIMGPEGGIAEVFDDTDPILTLGDVLLHTADRLYGYNDTVSGWGRARALAISSGQSQTSGVLMPFSGYFLGTASMIIDNAGTIANVSIATTSDIETPDTPVLDVGSFGYAYVNATSGWARLKATASGQGMSGIQHKLAVDFSGAIGWIGASGTITGLGKIADINGYNFDDGGVNDRRLLTQAAVVAFDGINNQYTRLRVTTSGLANSMSGVQIKLAVAFSGDNVFEHGSALITNPMTQVPSLSGGVVLSSGSVFSVTINSLSGNNPMWIGGTGSQAPFSGKGAVVYGGGSLSLKIDSVDDVRVFAEVSGQRVSWIGVQK